MLGSFGLLSEKPLAGSPQPACQVRQELGTVNKAQLSEGERDVLLCVVGDTAHPALHLQDGLHQQVGVIAPQVVKHHGDAGV